MVVYSLMMKFKSILTFFGIFIFIVPFATGQQRKSKQGIRGVVASVISQDTSNYSCTTSNVLRPVVREIAVYEPLKFSNLKHCDYAKPDCSPDVWDEVNGKLIKTIKSNRKGFFQVSLPEGKYSLIVKEEKGYYVPGSYLNLTDNIDVMPVEVVKDKTSEINLAISCSTSEKIYRLGKAVKAEIGEARATKISQCKFIAVGAKPCGGPTAYLAYSTAQTDEIKLIKLVSEYNVLGKKYNEEMQLNSDCMMVQEPSETYLEEGVCKIRQ